MPKFGTRSKQRLETAHPDLQRLFREVVKYQDCSVLAGHRTKEDQDKAFNDGYSKVHFPNSKHNYTPSQAVDVVPYFNAAPHIRWDDIERFKQFVGFVKVIAGTLDIKIKCGADFKSWRDYPHFQLDHSE